VATGRFGPNSVDSQSFSMNKRWMEPEFLNLLMSARGRAICIGVASPEAGGPFMGRSTPFNRAPQGQAVVRPDLLDENETVAENCLEPGEDLLRAGAIRALTHSAPKSSGESRPARYSPNLIPY
jgi:hypothetical protein